MYEIKIEGLQQLLTEARSAAAFARERYEEFAARKHTYTLYGPSAHSLGASIPSSYTPTRARKLLKTTRRRDYIVYELDEEYKVLRTVHMLDYTYPDYTYHHFELNGVSYAYPFRCRVGDLYNDKIAVMKYSANNPVYFAIASENLLFSQFYEYLSPKKMIVSTYRFFPKAKYTQYGFPVDWNAPIGELNSPVQRKCKEEVPQLIDFSQWFK